jgi:hypothetical protein
LYRVFTAAARFRARLAGPQTPKPWKAQPPDIARACIIE